MLSRKGSTGVVAVDVHVLGVEGELEGVLDHIFVELVVEQGVRVLLPGHRLQGQHVLVSRLFVARRHRK